MTEGRNAAGKRLHRRISRSTALLLAGAITGAAPAIFPAAAQALPSLSQSSARTTSPGAVVAFPGVLETTPGTIEVKRKGSSGLIGTVKLLHWSSVGIIVEIGAATLPGEYEIIAKDKEGPSEPPLTFTVIASTVPEKITPIESGTGSSLPLGVAEGPHREVWFSNAAANSIGELNASEKVEEYKLPTEKSHPVGIAVDQAGNVWVADNGIAAVTELEVAHASQGTSNGATNFPLSAGAVPTQVSVDPYGNVWVAEGNGVLGEITAGSHQIREWLLPGISELEGMVVDAFGNVWAVDESSGVAEIVPSQLPAPSATTAAASGVYHVVTGGGTEQIAAAPNGDIWFTEWSLEAKLGVIAPSTTSPTEDQVAYALNYPQPPGEAPSGIGIDAAGNVFVEDAASQAILEFTPSGVPASGSITGTWKENQVGSWITNYSEGDEGNNLAVLPSGDVVFSGYVTNENVTEETLFSSAEFIQGYLGRLPGIATPATSTGKTITGGRTTEEVVSGSPGDEVIVPAGTEIQTSAGTPFEGTLPAPVGDKSLIPGGTALFGDLLGGSAFSVSPELSDGVFSHVTFSKPVTVTFSFPLPAGTSAKEAEEAKLYYYNFSTLTWEEAGAESGDPGGKISVSGSTVLITLLTEHLSAFSAFHHPPTVAAPPPTAPPKVKVAPHVNAKTGAIEAEYEFPEAGEAESYGEIAHGATISRVLPSSLLAFAAEAPTGGGGQPGAQIATHGHAGHSRKRHHVRRAKRCKRGFIKHGKRCVNNAPIRYGRITLKVPGATVEKIVIKPTGKILAALKHGRKLAVNFALLFTPAGSTVHIPETASLVLHLKHKAPKRHHQKHKRGKHKRGKRKRG